MAEKEKRSENGATVASNNFVDRWDKKLARVGSNVFAVATVTLFVAGIYAFVSGDPRFLTSTLEAGAGASGAVSFALYSYGEK